jgi:uncharacterized membrane protein YtjA (UPF0391 family)
MLKWSIFFFLLSLVAAVLGFSDVAGAAAGIAKILFAIFLFGFLITVIFWIVVANKVKKGLGGD